MFLHEGLALMSPP